jgi:hypothetical protein
MRLSTEPQRIRAPERTVESATPVRAPHHCGSREECIGTRASRRIVGTRRTNIRSSCTRLLENESHPTNSRCGAAVCVTRCAVLQKCRSHKVNHCVAMLVIRLFFLSL